MITYVYGVHITQENSLKKVMTKELVEEVKRCGGALVKESKDPVKYLSSFVFPTRAKQARFAMAMNEMGVKIDVEKAPATVDSRDVHRGWTD